MLSHHLLLRAVSCRQQLCWAAPCCLSRASLLLKGLISYWWHHCLQEKVATATIDEQLAADPKTAAEIDEEIRTGDFMP